MIGLRFVIYVGLSLESVFGEDGISNKKSLQHDFTSDQATNTEKEYQNISELTQEDMVTDQEYQNISELTQEDMVTDQEYQNISELTQENMITDQEYQDISKLPQGRPEKLKKLFSLPTALGIGVSMLGLPLTGYTVYYLKNHNKWPILYQNETYTPPHNQKKENQEIQNKTMKELSEDDNHQWSKKQKQNKVKSATWEEKNEPYYDSKHPKEEARALFRLNPRTRTEEEVKELFGINPRRTNKVDNNPEEQTEEKKTEFKPKWVVGEVWEETSQVDDRQGSSIKELPVLEQLPICQGTIDRSDLGLKKGEEITWKRSVDDTQMEYAFPNHQTNLQQLQQSDLNIWTGKGSDIYSPGVYQYKMWNLPSEMHLGLPRHCRKIVIDGRSPVDNTEIVKIVNFPNPIQYMFFLMPNEEYVEKFKAKNQPRLNRVESKKIDDMVDDLLKDEEMIAIGSIKTKMPIGWRVRAQVWNLHLISSISLNICSHSFDAKSGESIISLELRVPPKKEHKAERLRVITEIPKDILRHSLRTLADLVLNTLPERKDTTDQSTG